MKIRYLIKKYGFQKFGVLDNYIKTLIRDEKGQLILFNTRKEAKNYIIKKKIDQLSSLIIFKISK